MPSAKVAAKIRRLHPYTSKELVFCHQKFHLLHLRQSKQRACVDNPMVKAIARAHRWRRLLESGEYTSVSELAAAEKINQSYVCRDLRLTLLAPDVVEAILDGRHTAEMTLATMMGRIPVGWQEQRLLRFEVNS